MKPNAPCFKCEERKVGCHSSCGDYKLFQDNKMEYFKKVIHTKEKEGRFYLLPFKQSRYNK